LDALVFDLDAELFWCHSLVLPFVLFSFCHVKISLGREGGTSPIEMAEKVVGYLDNKGYLQA